MSNMWLSRNKDPFSVVGRQVTVVRIKVGIRFSEFLLILTLATELTTAPALRALGPSKLNSRAVQFPCIQ